MCDKYNLRGLSVSITRYIFTFPVNTETWQPAGELRSHQAPSLALASFMKETSYCSELLLNNCLIAY